MKILQKAFYGLLFMLILMVGIATPKAEAAEGVVLPSVNENLSYYTLQGILGDTPYHTNALVENNKIIDLMTGNTLKEFDGYYYTSAVNQDGSIFAFGNYSNLTISDGFNEKEYNLRELTDDYVDLDYYKTTDGYYSLDSFIPNEDIVLLSSKTNLVAFNVKTGRVEYTVGLSNSNHIIATPSNIFSISDNQINVYDTKGNYLDVIVPEGTIQTAIVSPDYTKLYVATTDKQIKVYGLTSNFDEVSLKSNAFYVGDYPVSQMHIDTTGKYLATTSENIGFRLYEVNTGLRIYTQEDGNRGPSYVMPNGKFLLIGNELYNGKNLNKYVKAIKLSTKLETLEVGTSYTPAILATLADGTTQTISTGVKLQSSSLQIAYFDKYKNKLMATKKGTTTIRASYLGFNVDKKIKVVDTKKPIIKGAKNKTIYQWSYFGIRNGITAYDGNINLTNKIKITGKVNTAKPGTYKITYSVLDGAGHKTTKTISVKVKKW
ncbi:immunoglobulin-like domain-containing protein [Rummeliibacillus sp. JY-2-4R]